MGAAKATEAERAPMATAFKENFMTKEGKRRKQSRRGTWDRRVGRRCQSEGEKKRRETMKQKKRLYRGWSDEVRSGLMKAAQAGVRTLSGEGVQV
jgi:hypothetical protein